jgi:hypothetical protein
MGRRDANPSSVSGSWVVMALLVILAVPVALTLHTVRSSAYRPLHDVVAADPSPYGYSVSLLIFVAPILVLLFWFIPQEHLRIAKRAFLWTIAVLFPLGAALDFFLAQFFFRYPNPAATLRIDAPALGHWVPIEEYLFYLTGFLAILSIYVWLDIYWLQAFSVPDDHTGRASFDRLLGFHPTSLLLAVGLIAAAILYRGLAQPGSPGFPGYFTFLALTALMPSVALYRAVHRMVNWRALGLTLFVILLISLLWKATLAIPYGWWAYESSAMLGLYVRAWDNLPIEAVILWIAVTYATVLVYETIRCWHASGRPAADAFFRHKRSDERHPAAP